ncbi:hypothetical protein LTR36_002948 [Oleoguttula mirabilis]|uniref:Uncharacterized protein n=1 Tax=Oleoguttula mirabilis TaxID=1507867 RepID=A0AAV9JXU1_9PEZI|nr:hypothetical protein LTR36_002948 [Oleoguttula mirabilis]
MLLTSRHSHSNIDVAATFLPIAKDYIRGDTIGDGWDISVTAPKSWPDIDSVMSYSSYRGSEEPDDDEAWMLQAHNTDDPHVGQRGSG